MKTTPWSNWMAMIRWTSAAVLLVSAVPIHAANPASVPPQAFVKVNGLYFLYTAPVVPYVNTSGVLMVGLEGFGRGLFAKALDSDAQAKLYEGDDYGRVTVDPAARRETLTLGSHTVTFTADSATAQADGLAVPLGAFAHWDVTSRQMVVPAAALARCLGLTAAWDPMRRILSVTAPDAMTSRDVDDMAEYDARDDHASLVPWRVAYHKTGVPVGARYALPVGATARTPWLMYEARNVSGASADSEELNVLVLYSKAEMSSNRDGIEWIRANGPSPTVPPGGVRRFALALPTEPADDAVPSVLSATRPCYCPECLSSSPGEKAGKTILNAAMNTKEQTYSIQSVEGTANVALTEREIPALQVADRMRQVAEQIETVIIGKRAVVDLMLTAFLCGGHVLIEDIPGVGKTTLAKAVARALGCVYKRVQFTPDLLPADITGSSIFNQKTSEFEFREGPVFANIVLADEINRATPRTQSSLLECMEERQVTADGITYELPRPFFVIATENDIEAQGTYPLPEAQMDRFVMRLSIGYPDRADEARLLARQTRARPLDTLETVITREELLALQDEVRDVYVDESLRDYIVDIVAATRTHPQIQLGASPRGSLYLLHAAQAAAALDGRTFVLPDDIKRLAAPVLAHRLILRPDARLRVGTADALIAEIVSRVPVPIAL